MDLSFVLKRLFKKFLFWGDYQSDFSIGNEVKTVKNRALQPIRFYSQAALLRL